MDRVNWIDLPFSEAVQLNPRVNIDRVQEYPFVDMQALDPSRPIVEAAEQRVFRGGTKFRDGDTLMARITPCLENGKISRYSAPDPSVPAHGSTEFIVIRGRDGCTSSDYASFLARSSLVRTFAIAQMTGSSGRQRVPVDSLRNLMVPVPPLPEQQAIAEVLGALDDKIELNRQMNATLEELARTIFRSWFVDFDPVHARAESRAPFGMDADIADLFPDSFVSSELGDIPAGWIVQPISEVAGINTWTLGKKDVLDPIEYVEISAVNRGDIAEIITYPRGTEPGRARRRLRHGDTVVSMVRPDRGAYFLALDPPANRLASTGFAVVTPVGAPWSVVHAALTQPEVSSTLGHLADGGAYPAVRPERIAELPIVLPLVSWITDKFHRLAEPLYEKAALNRQESQTLAELRDTLLPKLLSGEITVKAAERELVTAT